MAEPIREVASDRPYVFEGACHCGAAGFTLRTSQPPERWQVRACQCSFCRAHGARTVTDPRGSVTFRVAEPSKLKRYRFATRSADYLICGACGVYIAAVFGSTEGQFATVNVNALHGLEYVPDAVPVSYDGESPEQRASRRAQRWTPVADAI
jgi:hypothetical protein